MKNKKKIFKEKKTLTMAVKLPYHKIEAIKIKFNSKYVRPIYRLLVLLTIYMCNKII